MKFWKTVKLIPRILVLIFVILVAYFVWKNWATLEQSIIVDVSFFGYLQFYYWQWFLIFFVLGMIVIGIPLWIKVFVLKRKIRQLQKQLLFVTPNAQPQNDDVDGDDELV